MTMEIEVGEIRNRLGRAVSRHLACSYKATEALSHFHVHEVRRVELVLVSKQASLDPRAKRSLQQKFEQG